MSDLSETEIFSRMIDSCRAAASACDDLAIRSVKGQGYHELRKHLALIEGCARQAATWREDSRWLNIAKMMGECHHKAGDWLRGYKDPITGQRISTAPGQRNELFTKLGDNLRALLNQIEQLQTMRTGQRGIILPEIPVFGRRVGAPVAMNGLILPPPKPKRHAASPKPTQVN